MYWVNGCPGRPASAAGDRLALPLLQMALPQHFGRLHQGFSLRPFRGEIREFAKLRFGKPGLLAVFPCDPNPGVLPVGARAPARDILLPKCNAFLKFHQKSSQNRLKVLKLPSKAYLLFSFLN